MANVVTEEKVERAIEYLRTSASPAAQAAAERWYMEEYRKVVKAELMAESNESAANAKEVYAYNHQRYRDHLEATREAIQREKEHLFRREAAKAVQEAYKTQSFNERALTL